MINLIMNYSNNSLIAPEVVFSQAIINNNSSDRTQLWIDKENNARIIFTYEPENPVIGNTTELLFNVQNMHTGEQMKNLSARIIITNGQKIFRITNMTSSKGDFSINYTFLDSGSYEVISRIDSGNLAALASFKVVVPTQALSSGSRSFSVLMLYYVTPITSAAVIVVYLSYRKKM
jgi:hypothetical protein